MSETLKVRVLVRPKLEYLIPRARPSAARFRLWGLGV